METIKKKILIEIWGNPKGKIKNYDVVKHAGVKEYCLKKEEDFKGWNVNLKYKYDPTTNTGVAYTAKDEYELYFEYSEELEAKLQNLTLMKEVEALIGFKA